ncbi:MAG TPA: SURF1 family protein [Gemmatimonadaceae bacterium]|nr:SURF1 family protein [Gemmatimonadaceae bacterium]
MKGARLWLFVAIAVAAAAGCIRLGVWQLSRLHQRRARNALVISRLDSAEADVTQLPHDTAEARFRRARVTGVADYAHELIYAARTHNGSPGVNLLTPVRIPGHDTAVLVNRGWIYAPDGASVDQVRWRDTATTFSGYAEEIPSVSGTAFASKPNVISRLGYAAVSHALPYPVSPVYVVLLGDSVMRADKMARLTVPPLDEGPHMSYAIQWFAFACVALGGAGIVITQSRRERHHQHHGGAFDDNDAPD